MCVSSSLRCRDSTTTSHDDTSDQEDPRTSLLPAKSLAATPLPSRASSTVSDNTALEDAAAALVEAAHPASSAAASLAPWSRFTPTKWWSWLLYTILYSACITTPRLLYDAFRLGLFVVCLAPGFYQFVKYYVTFGNRRVERYSAVGWRRTVDIYGAADSDRQKPVIVFFTGGAWVIGYKMWGAFLAKAMTPFGILVVIPDYPNYPMVTMPQMVDAAEEAIQWTLDNVERLGGDPTRVVLVGQSAGGHLCSCVLLRKALNKLKGITTSATNTTFKPTDLAGFVSISAPNDIQAMERNFLKHGLNHNFLQSLFGDNHPANSNNKPMMDVYDPLQMVQEYQELVRASISAQNNNTRDRWTSSPTYLPPSPQPEQCDLPPMSVFHGTGDQTVPYTVSQTFAHALRQANVTTEYVAYEGWSHTDPILEGIMEADHRFHADLYERLVVWTNAATTSTNDGGSNNNNIPPHFDASIPECQALCPTLLVNMGRWFNPF